MATSLRAALNSPGFVGDGGSGLGGVERLDVAGDAITVELVAEHVEGDGADGLVGGGDGLGGVGWGGEIASADVLHDGGHLAGGGFAEAEFGLVGGYRGRWVAS